jgi:hypothetical protein
MTAIEAMAREDGIRRRERTIQQSRQLQYECQQIAKPFHDMINDIYLRSNFTLTFTPGGPFTPPVYPPETEAMVAKVKEEARKAITAQVEMYERRRLGIVVA